MYREGTGPVLEDVLLSDQFLYEYSPAESIVNFELPSAFDSENSDWLSDVDLNCDAFVSDLSDNSKNDFSFAECSPVSFDFAALDRSIDEYLLEALSNDRSNETPQSGTDSADSCDGALGTLTVLDTQLDLMCVQSTHNYTRPQWKTRVEETKPESKVRSWGEPSFCPELGAFRCPVENCGKLYAKASHVRAHLRRHSGEKPYRCTWGDCAWRFARSDELARHRRSHSGDKPYGCTECTKRFARSDHLAKHGRVHARRAAIAAATAAKRTASSTHSHRTRRLL